MSHHLRRFVLSYAAIATVAAVAACVQVIA